MAGFVFVTDEDLSELTDGANSSNTKKQIQYAISRLEAFAVFAGTSLAEVEALTDEELDTFLSRFFAGLRKADGSFYTKKSMHGIKYGLHRHFKAVRDVDITKPDTFHRSYETYKAMMCKLKQAGKGYIKHRSAITKDDMAKIFASDVLDISTPMGLQNKVFMDVMIYIANRGRENLRDMKIDDFVMQTSEKNLRYITHKNTLTKPRGQDEDEGFSGYMYEIPGSKRCPVSTFLLYKAVLNPALDCLWQRPKPTAPAEGSWYCSSPLGVNTLGNKMKEIAKAAGCTKKYTNHSLKATAVTVLEPLDLKVPVMHTNIHEGRASKRTRENWRKRLCSDSEEEKPNLELAPIESDPDEGPSTVSALQRIRRNAEGSTSGNGLSAEDTDDDETFIESDADSDSVVEEAVCMESDRQRTAGCSPMRNPSKHIKSDHNPGSHSAETSPPPDISDPAPLPSQGPAGSQSPCPTISIPTHCSPTPSLHSLPPSPVSLHSVPELTLDATSFWKSCNAAGCTEAIFSEFIRDMNRIFSRIQCDQASQEDYNVALKVIMSSGKLTDLVSKQHTELKKKQLELQNAAGAMQKIMSALR